MKKILAYICTLVLLASCTNTENTTVNALYSAELLDKMVLLEDQLLLRLEQNKRYRGYEMEFYVQTQEAILRLFRTVDTKMLSGAHTRQNLLFNYKKQLLELNSLCTELKKNKKYFLAQDFNELRTRELDSIAHFKIKDDSLLKLILLSDIKTQLNKISYHSQNFGCHLGITIKNANFHDFFIFQMVSKESNLCHVTIKNNFLSQNVNSDKYALFFKSITQIKNADTVIVDVKPDFRKLKSGYSTNDFHLARGNYLFSTELKFEMPDGAVKVGEMAFEFEIK
ncbi:MAG: hypothetical protein IT236_17760 [Bacteroidia bacterium]|nr:hypothetical protein [Bacteroidia bacterium]